ncbi:hypothetical protein [uncultured Ferrimonas sp.]|uniref:hypothetical protein n=1 Tax=uncultured Ferrimonas sp. TaxID=432640 RepID=UPI002606F632|nr:hypothetical protein [uncultured Ferrimonas sp.]
MAAVHISLLGCGLSYQAISLSGVLQAANRYFVAMPNQQNVIAVYRKIRRFFFACCREPSRGERQAIVKQQAAPGAGAARLACFTGIKAKWLMLFILIIVAIFCAGVNLAADPCLC